MSRLLAGKRVVCPKTSASSVLAGTPSRRRRDASRNWPAVLLASPERAVGSVRTADEPNDDERPPSFAATIQRETTEHYIKRVGSWPADVPRFLCCSLQSSAPAVGGFPPRAIGVNLYRASRTSFSIRPVLRPHDILLEHEPCQGAFRERQSRELTSDRRESVWQCSWTERAASRPLRLSGADWRTARFVSLLEELPKGRSTGPRQEDRCPDGSLHRNTSISLKHQLRYRPKGTSTYFSPTPARIRRSTGVERLVGTVPRYVPASGRAPIGMFTTVPSAMRAMSKTLPTTIGWPAGSKRRTA